MNHKYSVGKYVFMEHIFFHNGNAWNGYVSAHKITKLLGKMFDFNEEPCYEIDYAEGLASRIEIESNLFGSKKEAYNSILQRMKHGKKLLNIQKERIESEIRELDENIKEVMEERDER